MKTQKLISIMAEVVEVLSLSGKPQHIYDGVLDTFIELIPVNACWIQCLGPDRYGLIVVSHRALSRTNLEELNSLNLGSEIDGQTLGSGGSIIISDLNQQNSRNISSFLKDGLHSLAFIPLRTHHLHGFLGLGFRASSLIDKDLIALVSVISDLIFIVADRSRIKREMEMKANIPEMEPNLNVNQERLLVSGLKEYELLQPEGSDIDMAEFKRLAVLCQNYSKEVQDNIQRAVLQAQARIPQKKTNTMDQVKQTKHRQDYIKDEELNSVGTKNPFPKIEQLESELSPTNGSSPVFEVADRSDRVSNLTTERFKKHNLDMLIFRRSHH